MMSSEASYDRKMSVKCMSRQTRDLIVLVIRSFSVINYISHSLAIESLFAAEMVKKNLNVMIDLETAVREVSIFTSHNSQLRTEKNALKNDLETMEREMEETIEAYKRIVAHHASGSNNTEMEEEIEKLQHEMNIAIVNKKKIRRKYREANEENKELNKQIRRLNTDIDKLTQSIQSNEEVEKVHKAQQKMMDTNEELKQNITEMQAKIDKIAERKRRYEQKIADVKETTQETQRKLCEVREKNEELSSKIQDKAEFQSNFAKIKHENEALKGQRSIFTKKLEGIENELSSVNSAKSELEEEVLELQKTSSKQDEIQELQEALERTLEESSRYKKQADGLAAQFSRIQAQLRRARN